VRRLEAQVNRRGHHLPRGKDGIGELEERVGAVVKAAVERVTEGTQGIEGFHNRRILLPGVVCGYSPDNSH
jgi:hypothetical protein